MSHDMTSRVINPLGWSKATGVMLEGSTQSMDGTSIYTVDTDGKIVWVPKLDYMRDEMAKRYGSLEN